MIKLLSIIFNLISTQSASGSIAVVMFRHGDSFAESSFIAREAAIKLASIMQTRAQRIVLLKIAKVQQQKYGLSLK